MNITDNERANIIGKLIHDERKTQKKSAEIISSFAGISQQYLSEIERGKKNLSFFSINRIFETLNINFKNDLHILEQADDLLNSIIHDYICFNREDLFLHTTELVTDYYKYSYAYPYYIAGILSQECLIKRQNMDMPPLLMQNNHKLNMFLFFCAEKCIGTHNDFRRLNLIQNGFSMYTPHIEDPSIMALYSILLSDQATIYETDNRMLDALTLNRKALSVAKENYFFTFSLSIEVNIANIYSKMGQVDLSTKQNLRILNLADKIKHENIRNAAKFNLASNYLFAQQYDKCIQMSLELLKVAGQNPNFQALYYFLTFSYFMTGKYDAAKKYGSLFLQLKEEDSFSVRFTQLLVEAINDKLDIKKLKNLFLDAISQGDPTDVEITFKLLINQLKERGNYKEAVECYEYYFKKIDNKR